MGTVVQGVDLFDAGEKDYRPIGQPTLTFEIELAGIERYKTLFYRLLYSYYQYLYQFKDFKVSL